MLPGNPRCSVTSISPTSMPNSRAFVAATPHILPLKKSLSILLLSYSHQTVNFNNRRYNWSISITAKKTASETKVGPLPHTL